jgi:hypothetical protein
MDSKRTGLGYYIAVVILGALLIAAVAFVVAMIARPSAPAASVLAVTDRAPVACLTEKQGSTCFTTQVTNNGAVKSTFHCEVSPTGDADASFEAGQPFTNLVLDVDQSVEVQSVVAARPADATAPSVSCAPLSS